jgi:hypothetical protein
MVTRVIPLVTYVGWCSIGWKPYIAVYAEVPSMVLILRKLHGRARVALCWEGCALLYHYAVYAVLHTSIAEGGGQLAEACGMAA